MSDLQARIDVRADLEPPDDHNPIWWIGSNLTEPDQLARGADVVVSVRPGLDAGELRHLLGLIAERAEAITSQATLAQAGAG
jgi:hypothetical protein